jgi:hypothetical protein
MRVKRVLPTTEGNTEKYNDIQLQDCMSATWQGGVKREGEKKRREGNVRMEGCEKDGRTAGTRTNMRYFRSSYHIPAASRSLYT